MTMEATTIYTKGQLRSRLRITRKAIETRETELDGYRASRDACILYATRHLGMTEREVADLAGVSPARVNQIKNGALHDDHST